MQAAEAPIPASLPAARATRHGTAFTLIFGVITLLFVFIALLQPILYSPLRWHLPWPALQWVVTTPLGNLSFFAFCVLVAALPLFLSTVRDWRRGVAQARDCTDVPLEEWALSQPARLRPPLSQRWLGSGGRQRAVSVVLLALGILLGIVLVSAVCAAFWFNFVNFRELCSGRYGCEPNNSLTSFPAFGLIVATGAVSIIGRFWWLKRVETTCGVWLYYPVASATTLCYVRQSGVTPEAATTALARFSSAGALAGARPSARSLFYFVLSLSLWAILLCVTYILNAWLSYQWLPG